MLHPLLRRVFGGALRSSMGPHARQDVPLAVPKPSASIMLISPTNQLLLLHRVKTSRSFASAHVFPGGNCHEYQEGPIPAPSDPARHADSEVYRLAAIRETFEESGILLAKDKHGEPLSLPGRVRAAGRKAVHANDARFTDWVAEHGGAPDTDALVPFTRWITPPGLPRRFTAQMYLYFLPFNWKQEQARHDGGLEHTAADFDEVSEWLRKAHEGEIVLYSPQAYLISLLAQFFTGPGDYAAQRQDLLAFVHQMPTGRSPHPSAQIPWADKVMSPYPMSGLNARPDKCTVIAVDDPGPELKGTSRGGDWDRVILSNLGLGERDGGRLLWRQDVIAEDLAVKGRSSKL